MPETTPLIKAALNLRGGAGFDVYQKNDIIKKAMMYGRVDGGLRGRNGQDYFDR